MSEHSTGVENEILKLQEDIHRVVRMDEEMRVMVKCIVKITRQTNILP